MPVVLSFDVHVIVNRIGAVSLIQQVSVYHEENSFLFGKQNSSKLWAILMAVILVPF